MFDCSVKSVWSSDMTKSRRPHPIVQVVQNAASEINDVLNAISLRISLLQHQVEASAFEAEIARLAGLIEKASQRIHRLDDYARAEELVASMRLARNRKRSRIDRSPSVLSEPFQRTALLITDSSGEDSAIKECLERSGCTVVIAGSSDEGLSLLQSNQSFDHIVCDSTLLAESGGKFTTELSRTAPETRVYVLERPVSSERTFNRAH
jgi:PleD family two-component response regulator